MLALSLLWGDAARAEDSGPAPVEITPQPIGAAARLVEARSLENVEQIPLPLEGLEPVKFTVAPRSAGPAVQGIGLREVRMLADPTPAPEVRTRALGGPVESVQAGPIWSNTDAQGKCPAIVAAARWTGASTATASPLRTLCECTAGSVSPVRVRVEIETRAGIAEAPRLCPTVCAQVRWTGHWWTTVPGMMSVCQLEWPAPPPPLPVPAPTPTPAPTPAPAPAPASSSSTPSGESEELALERMRQTYQLLQSKLPELQRLRAEREERLRQEAEAQRDVRGPSALGAINLLEGLHVDPGIALQPSDVLGIDHQVYQDANPQTGLFYFAPKRYDLRWDPAGQYGMTVIYGMSGAESEQGEVFMSARLGAGTDARELVVARRLLISYLRRHAEQSAMRFREFRPLPLKATSDVVLFGGAKNQFAVPPEKISVQGVSGLLSAIDVSWAIDLQRLLNVETLLRTDAGIHGTITFHAAGQEGLKRTIPLEIAVASPQTFGRIPFDPAKGWTNATYYPIRLSKLHALVVANESRGSVRSGDPVIYSWDLGESVVPPGGRVDWNPERVPGWIQTRALLLWATYAVDSGCEPCDDRVFDAKFIPERPPTSSLVVTSGDVFESTGAQRLSLTIRSPFLDPQRDRIRAAQPVMLERDGVERRVAELFLTDRETQGEGVKEPLYEYSLEVAMRDGRTYRPEKWIPSRDLDLLLGSAVLREIFGALPGTESQQQPEP